MIRAPVWAALAALILAACATRSPGPAPQRPGVSAPPLAERPEPPPARRLALAALRGWNLEDHGAAYAAFRETCRPDRRPELAPACQAARTAGPLPGESARSFLETWFDAESVGGEGVLTAYFAPVYAARRSPDAEFSAPVRPKPADLRVEAGQVLQHRGEGPPLPYPERSEIEAQPPQAPLAWMRPEELFFLQIQGSGVLIFEDGRRMKAVYAANNGRPFVGVANAMRDRGLLARDNTSGEAIRAWLADNRGPAADEIMRLNPRYAFFSLQPDDGRMPAGAAGIPLPAGRAIAIDPARHGYGELFWLDAEAPLLAGAFPTYRRLTVALDTGGAIKGEVRADLFLGQGPAAGTEAGRVRHRLRMYRLVPRP